jgi:hypothetical protein
MFLRTFSRVVWRGIVSGRILNLIASITVVATLLVSGVVFGVSDTARADNCLTAPNSSAPQGSHWYYRTDQANQRKCWYFRAPGEPAQQATARATSEAPAARSHGMLTTNSSTGAPMSISPGDIAPKPRYNAKMLAVEPKPAPAVGTTTDKLVQGSAQEGNTATSDELAPSLPVAWPEPQPAVETIHTQENIAAPTDGHADSARVEADTLASNNAEGTAESDEPSTIVGMAGSLRATPQMFLIIALGLTLVGILSRIVMTIGAARRARVIFNHPESDRIDDQCQDEWRDDQDEYGSGDGREADYPPVSTARDYGPARLFQTDSGSARDLNEVSKQDDTLAQLRRELDRLLQSERAGQPMPSRDDEQHTRARSFGASGQTQGEALRKALGLA